MGDDDNDDRTKNDNNHNQRMHRKHAIFFLRGSRSERGSRRGGIVEGGAGGQLAGRISINRIEGFLEELCPLLGSFSII